MPEFIAVLFLLALIGTLGVLLTGVISMARGGPFNRRNANKLMRARVVLQGLALLLFAILMTVLGKS